MTLRSNGPFLTLRVVAVVKAHGPHSVVRERLLGKRAERITGIRYWELDDILLGFSTGKQPPKAGTCWRKWIW